MRFLGYVLRRWLELARILGAFNTRILLGIVFVLVFIPAGLIMRLSGRDPLGRKFMSGPSYWESCKLSGLMDKNRYARPF